MSNEQEIAAIEKALERAGLLGEYYNKSVARALVNAGYRKTVDVAKKILQDIDNLAAECGLDKFRAVELRKYAKRLGVEVDE